MNPYFVFVNFCSFSSLEYFECATLFSLLSYKHGNASMM